MTRLTILSVDDETIIQLGNEALITGLGHDVLTASEPGAALTLIAENPAIDVLMTDFEMPNASGADLARAALDLRPDLKVILVTGRLEIDDHVEPGWGVLLKPFDPEQLRAVLEG